MLENPKVLAKLKADGKPSVEVPEEFKKKCVSKFLPLRNVSYCHPEAVQQT
jgi:hypothetical protein